MDSPKFYSQRRPPFFSNNSSSSSLSGMEKPVTSFQTFVRTTPPLNPSPSLQKALPPIPPQVTAHQPARDYRASSVYSRSTWVRPASWQLPDRTDDPAHPNDFFLQPTTSNSSTPNLARSRPAPPALEPRTFSPLIPEPSPVSTVWPPESFMLATSGVNLDAPVSKWKQQFENLPPSPLSPQGFRFPASSSAATSLRSEPSPTRTRESSPPAMRMPPNPLTQHPHTQPATNVEHTPVQNSLVVPRPTHVRAPSAEKALDSLGLYRPDSPAPRGRARTREVGPRTRDYAHYMPGRRYGNTRRKDRGALELEDEEREDEDDSTNEPRASLTDEYHQLLINQYRELAAPHDKIATGRRFDALDRDDEQDGRDIRLVPAPLFWNKGRSSQPLGREAYANGCTRALDHGRPSRSRAHGKRPSLSAPLKMMLPSQLRNLSRTSAEIPISPPSDYEQSTAQTGNRRSSPRATSARPRPRGQERRGDPSMRFSTFYPRARPANTHKSKPKKATKKAENVPLLPLHLASSLSLSPRPPSDRARMTSNVKLTRLTHKTASPVRHEKASQRVRGCPPVAQQTDAAAHVEYGYGYSFGYDKEDQTATSHVAESNSQPTHPRVMHRLSFRGRSARTSAAYSSSPTSVKEAASQGMHAALHKAKKSLSSSKGILPFHDRLSGSSRPSTPSSPRQAASERTSEEHSHRPSLIGKVMEARREHTREKRRADLKKSIRVVGEADPHAVETRDSLLLEARKRETFGAGWI